MDDGIFKTKRYQLCPRAGILYGTMTLELGGKVTIECEKTKCSSELEFKLKVARDSLTPVTLQSRSCTSGLKPVLFAAFLRRSRFCESDQRKDLRGRRSRVHDRRTLGEKLLPVGAAIIWRTVPLSLSL